MRTISQLSDDILVRIANWNPAVPGWPDFRNDDSPAPYLKLIESLEALDGLSLLHKNGHEYGDTFFGFFLHRPVGEFPRLVQRPLLMIRRFWCSQTQLRFRALNLAVS